MSGEHTPAAEALRCIGTFIDDAEHFVVDDSVVDIGPAVAALTVLTETAAERDRLRAEVERLKPQAEGLCDSCGEPLGEAYCAACVEVQSTARRKAEAQILELVAALHELFTVRDKAAWGAARAAYAKATATEGANG